MNLFDNCHEKLLSSELNWLNEPNNWGFDANQSLAISAPANADFFIDPSGETIKSSAPFLYTIVPGDFTLTTRVGVDMKHQYDSGCLMVMSDDQHWAKLCYEFFGNKRSILSVVTNNTSDDCISGKVDSLKPYLRIARAGNCFAFHYSLDGEQWELVRYFGMDCTAELKVGIVAQSPIGEGCLVQFDYLHLIQSSNGDIRTVIATI
ncbi:DUF1349 domain-containing protein [Cohnella mopanensis]|uniref:DUF1349 domain-containing protein n=1 Tax=Cohnella mopanensis TaxID=2911966 RepID=UPI001EF8BEEE|nr:DUF1349 domain-containing protein [Cohnella mopanensis]